MAKSNLALVREAIEIQGYVVVRFEGASYRITGIKGADTDGSWITTQVTPDLRASVRIKKTKASVIEQAKHIIANADTIRAKREADSKAAMDRMMNS